MNTFGWWTSRFSCRGEASSLYRRGIARARELDHQGAINDYTATIDMPDAPSGVKAMALYNRALEHVVTGDYTRGVDDLDAVLAMDDAPVNVKRRAEHKLAQRESRSRKAK